MTNTRALIDLRRAEIYTNQGQTEQAQAAYLDAVQNYPTSPNTFNALAALVEAGVPVNELQRGIIDYFAGQYGVALAAFDRYLQNAPADPASAHYYYALTQRKLGNYAEAVQSWEKVIQDFPDHTYWDNAWEEKAYTQWAYPRPVQPGHADPARLCRKKPGAPAGGRVPERCGAGGRDATGSWSRRPSLWERVANEYPGDERALRALFLLGITRYRLAAVPAGLGCLPTPPGRSPVDLHDRAAAIFWIGKAQAALNDNPARAAGLGEGRRARIPPAITASAPVDLLFNRPAFEPPLSYDLDL